MSDAVATCGAAVRPYPRHPDSRNRFLTVQKRLWLVRRRVTPPATVGAAGLAAELATLLLAPLAFAPPPACFDASCQRDKDIIFILSLVLPTLAAGLGAYLTLGRRPAPDSLDGELFEDESTGVLFEAPKSVQPARDSKGELAFRVVGYTPWPVQEGAHGERVRIEIGPVGKLQPRTFIIEKQLLQPSQLVTVSLPRPLGIVFEEEKRSGRAVVAELVEGSAAEQLYKQAKLNPSLSASAPAPGDILRACTCTTITYPTAALLFGAKQPQRTISVFSADSPSKWPQVAGALKRGLKEDGNVVLVLERKLEAA